MNYDELLKVDTEKRNLPYSKIVELEQNLPSKKYTFREVMQMFPHLQNHILEVCVGGLQNANVKTYYDVHFNDEKYIKLAEKKVISIYVFVSEYIENETSITNTTIALASGIPENDLFSNDEPEKPSFLEKFFNLIS